MVVLTSTDYRIRERMWNLLAKIGYDRKIKSSELHKGICSYTNFYNNILSNPVKVAWLFAPLKDLDAKMQIHKSVLISKLKDILELPIRNENGKFSYRNIDQILRASTLIFRDKI